MVYLTKGDEMNKIIYLDNAATTKMFDCVLEQTSKYLTDEFFNPSAVYSKSVMVKKEVEQARASLMHSLGVDSGNLIFTGSATEANNMIVFSQRNFANKKYLFGAGEHPSVMQCAMELEKRGYNVEYIPLDKTGSIDIEKYVNMLSKDVAFISIQHVSNETGAINNIEKLVKMARKYNPEVLFHSDGVQAYMKFEYSLLNMDVDYYTISAHKIGGPKGIGALYTKKGKKLNPLVFGGGQEFGLRSGTENVFAIKSFELCAKKMQEDRDRNFQIVASQRKNFLSSLDRSGIKYKVHGENGVPHTMNICLSDKVRGETLVHALEAKNVFISTGSACSATKHFNSTLQAMGINSDEILKSVRISFSAYEQFDAEYIVQIIRDELLKLEGK